MKQTKDKKNKYIGNRYVPKHDSLWDINKDYESLTVVLWEGNSYTTRKNTPAGVDIKNKEYWALSANFNAQIENYRRKTQEALDLANGVNDKVDVLRDDFDGFQVEINQDFTDFKDQIGQDFTDFETTINQELETTKTEINQDLETNFNNFNHEVTTRLAQTEKQILKKNQFRKSLFSTKIKDDFKNGLDKWDITTGYTISNGEMTIDSKSSVNPNHLNVALLTHPSGSNSIEVVLGSVKPHLWRLVVAIDKTNFIYVTNIGIRDSKEADVYRVENGQLTGPFKLVYNKNHTFVENDKLRLKIHGESSLQLYVNDSLMGSFTIGVDNTYSFLIPKENYQLGISQRDITNAWSIKSANVVNEQRKYAHFSIDDVTTCLADLTTNANSYNSAFENEFLGRLKKMHDVYGAVFTLNTFNEHNGFSLSNMTDKFKVEFSRNAHWLKFAFHSNLSTTNYSTDNGSTIITHYEFFVSQVRRFSSGYNIARFTRLGFFGGSLNATLALKNASVPVLGFMSSDDSRISDYYLNATQRETLKYTSYLDDYENGFRFIRTMPRMDSNSIDDIQTEFEHLQYSGRWDILEFFGHEDYQQNLLNKFENACRFASENGYIFTFPELMII